MEQITQNSLRARQSYLSTYLLLRFADRHSNWASLHHYLLSLSGGTDNKLTTSNLSDLIMFVVLPTFILN